MFDTSLGRLDTCKHLVPARVHHVRHPRGKPGKLLAEDTVSGYYTYGVDALTLPGSRGPPQWGRPSDHKFPP
eukprot:9488675-Pyramimonas_sp.AAC.1